GTSNNVNVSLGQLNANGTATGNRDIVVMIHDVSGPSNGSLTVAGANAQNGEIIFDVLGGAGSLTGVTGNVTVNGAINAARFVRINAPDDVTTRAIGAGDFVEITTRQGSIATRGITVSNTNRTAGIILHAGIENFASGGADVTVDGNINVSGRAT